MNSLKNYLFIIENVFTITLSKKIFIHKEKKNVAFYYSSLLLSMICFCHNFSIKYIYAYYSRTLLLKNFAVKF